MTKTKRIVLATAVWITALYSVGAFIILLPGGQSSGGPPKGYAENISCSRNWFAFGLAWSCEATVVADDGSRYPYLHRASALTPADIGKRVPMTTDRQASDKTSHRDSRWNRAERVEGSSKALALPAAWGPVLIAALITARLFRNKSKPLAAKAITEEGADK